MKLTVDREADALYLDLDESPAADSKEISPGVILDYNASLKLVRCPHSLAATPRCAFAS
jgi:uncharacterized protein YuzE